MLKLLFFIHDLGQGGGGKFEDYDHYSIHSGNDLAVRPLEKLAAFLEKDHKYGYF